MHTYVRIVLVIETILQWTTQAVYMHKVSFDCR